MPPPIASAAAVPVPTEGIQVIAAEIIVVIQQSSVISPPAIAVCAANLLHCVALIVHISFFAPLLNTSSPLHSLQHNCSEAPVLHRNTYPSMCTSFSFCLNYFAMFFPFATRQNSM